jgi:hypothetical protein
MTSALVNMCAAPSTTFLLHGEEGLVGSWIDIQLAFVLDHYMGQDGFLDGLLRFEVVMMICLLETCDTSGYKERHLNARLVSLKMLINLVIKLRIDSTDNVCWQPKSTFMDLQEGAIMWNGKLTTCPLVNMCTASRTTFLLHGEWAIVKVERMPWDLLVPRFSSTPSHING